MSISRGYDRSITNHLGNGEFTTRAAGHHDTMLHRDPEHDPKTSKAYKAMIEMYNEIKHSAIDEISRSQHTDPISLLEKEKKPADMDSVIQSLNFFVKRLVKYHVSLKEASDRKLNRNNTFGADEIIPMLETDLRNAHREQEKLRLLLDTAHLKIKLLEKKNDEVVHQSKKINYETQNEKSKLKSYIKNQGEQLKQLQEENLIIKRPTTGNSSVKRIRDLKTFKDAVLTHNRENPDRSSFDVLNTVKSSNSMIPDSIRQISTQMEQNKLHNLQNKHELKELRRQAEQEREKELTDKQKDLLIARLNIQVDERDKDLNRLKLDYDRIFNDLKKMKEKEAEREREEWTKEILSDRNPNLIEYYKKKLEEKKSMISFLKKQLRKYAISEKKVFIKEKAFELERAEYQDKMVYLQDRVSKLNKFIEDPKRFLGGGNNNDRHRKRRETNLNKSQTSSDDNEETKPSGNDRINIGTIGAFQDSFGKTPKVGSKSTKNAYRGD